MARSLFSDFFLTLSRRLAKVCVALFLLSHFTILFLASLPWSPFIASLYPYYSWYIYITAQGQGWGMYQYPMHGAPQYELKARFADGTEDWPAGTPETMLPRMAYLVEALFMGSDELADPLMQYFYNRYPENRKPLEIKLRYFLAEVKALDSADTSQPIRGPYILQREIVRRW